MHLEAIVLIKVHMAQQIEDLVLLPEQAGVRIQDHASAVLAGEVGHRGVQGHHIVLGIDLSGVIGGHAKGNVLVVCAVVMRILHRLGIDALDIEIGEGGAENIIAGGHLRPDYHQPQQGGGQRRQGDLHQTDKAGIAGQHGAGALMTGIARGAATTGAAPAGFAPRRTRRLVGGAVFGVDFDLSGPGFHGYGSGFAQATPARRQSWTCTMPTGLPASSTTNRLVMERAFI